MDFNFKSIMQSTINNWALAVVIAVTSFISISVIVQSFRMRLENKLRKGEMRCK